MSSEAPARIEPPRFPFSLPGPFDGISIYDKKGEEVYVYRPQPRQHFAHNCCCDEVFYGGAMYGGKSYWAFHHNGIHCLQHGKDANTLILRRTFPMLERSMIQLVLRYWDGKVGKYRSTDHLFEWNNGARTWFGHLERWEDTGIYDSAQFTLITFEELTQFQQRMYRYMFSRLRSPWSSEIHPQMLSTSNPGGIGHRWVYERFRENKEPYVAYEVVDPPENLPGGVKLPERVMRSIFVKALYQDNPAGLAADPLYITRVTRNMSEQEIKAKLYGDWELMEGLAFPEWDPSIHVIKPFPIPGDWNVTRTLDWGYATPFSAGWLTQDPTNADIYRIDEIYGAVKGPKGGVQGVRKSPPEIREAILNKEMAMEGLSQWPRPRAAGRADPSIWSTKAGEHTVGMLMNFRRPGEQEGSLYVPANNDRALRKQLTHTVLRVRPETGHPQFRAFDRCPEFSRTMRHLMRDENEPDKVAKDQEDHAFDDNTYGLAAVAGVRRRRTTAAEERFFQEQVSLPPML